MSDLPDELSYPDGLYQKILKMCAFHPINIIAGFYYGNKMGGMMGILLMASSINFWRNPNFQPCEVNHIPAIDLSK